MPNETVTYSYTVTNIGTSTLTSPFSVEDDRAEISCEYPASLAPQEQFTCTGTYLVTLEDLDIGFITNKAFAVGKDAENDEVTSNTDELTIEAQQTPLIGAAKGTLKVEEVSPGSYDVTFEFVIRNYGNVTLENVHITDDLKTAFSLPIAAQFTVLSLGK